MTSRTSAPGQSGWTSASSCARSRPSSREEACETSLDLSRRNRYKTPRMTDESLPAVLPIRRYSATRHESPREEWRDLKEHAHLLYSLVYRDLTVRYKRSVIGFLWTMLNPLLMMIIFTVVFSHLFR